MGLDMYLFKLNKETWDNYPRLNEGISELGLKVAYWRKANQIRNWFVRHVEDFEEDDNLGMYIITKDLLEKLLEDCNIVLQNKEKASLIMPVSDGYFFGPQEYGEWYFDDLEYTMNHIKEIIKDTDWDNEVIVYTEWW